MNFQAKLVIAGKSKASQRYLVEARDKKIGFTRDWLQISGCAPLQTAKYSKEQKAQIMSLGQAT